MTQISKLYANLTTSTFHISVESWNWELMNITCRTKQLYENPAVSYMIPINDKIFWKWKVKKRKFPNKSFNNSKCYNPPEIVGPQKFPSAKEAVKRPETTAWTSIESGTPELVAAFWAQPKLATRTAALPNPAINISFSDQCILESYFYRNTLIVTLSHQRATNSCEVWTKKCQVRSWSNKCIAYNHQRWSSNWNNPAWDCCITHPA